MKKHVVCFGDSNTHGYCAKTGGRFDENQRWTCLLQKKLGDQWLILEEGLSGRTTTFDDPIHEALSGLDYIYPCLMSHEPVDLLIIMLGTNDTKERFGASAECIALGLKRLISKAPDRQKCKRRLCMRFLRRAYLSEQRGTQAHSGKCDEDCKRQNYRNRPCSLQQYGRQPGACSSRRKPWS